MTEMRSSATFSPSKPFSILSNRLQNGWEEGTMKAFQGVLAACVAFGMATVSAHAVEISIAANSTGNNIKFL
ncbi:MAG TPA: ABC transporter substrate-binding protein, partial [Ochrobactrum anthropi]|nr:ABC transporter substrate-binding protein [Brucella anthropi]